MTKKSEKIPLLISIKKQSIFHLSSVWKNMSNYEDQESLLKYDNFKLNKKKKKNKTIKWIKRIKL